MGLRPTQGDENRGSDRSVHPSVTAAEVSAAFPLCHPERSRGICIYVDGETEPCAGVVNSGTLRLKTAGGVVV